MINIPMGEVALHEEVAFNFPPSNCCNCGTRKDVRVIAQDTRRTTYLGAGGTEITFQLNLPFCPVCVPSAKRRPKSLVHHALMFAVGFGAVFLGLIILGDVVYSIPALSKYLLPLSLLGAALIMGITLLVSQPKTRQTSYYQPVRISRLKREFVSGKVVGIRFFFSNRNYAALFERHNQQAISQQRVEVSS